MLGRQVGASLLRLPRCVHLPIRSLPVHQQSHGPLSAVAGRSYADAPASRPGRPKKAVGEPSRPVKRDVKRAAKSPKEDAATRKVKAKEAGAKERKTKKAPGYVRLTDEQKAENKAKRAELRAAAAAKKKAGSVAALKKLALNPPRVTRANAWVHFVKERNNLGTRMQGGTRDSRKATFGENSTRMSDEFKNITPAELEHFNHVAHTTREKELAAYKEYVESRSIEEIETANKARAKLRRLHKDDPSAVRKWPKIADERRVKQPFSPYIAFAASRSASGDFKNMKPGPRSKLISEEWRALTAEEKKKYENLHAKDQQRYTDEYTSVYGHAPPVASTTSAQAAAAAA